MPAATVAAAIALFASLSCTTRTAPTHAPAAGATDVGLSRPQDLGPATYPDGALRPRFPDAWPYPAGRAALFAAHGVAVSDAPIAAAVGAEVLRRGGNAVDAAVALAFALAVVYPEAGNIGGGGFFLVRMQDGRTALNDHREVAPAAAHRDMFADSVSRAEQASIVGARASGVPGAVAGLTAVLARYGTMPLAEVMAPAIRLAEEGFPVDSAQHAVIARNAELIARFAGRDVFLPGGAAPAVGSTFRQPALARTLRRIAATGGRDFYEGETARMLAAEMRRLGGVITERDLAAYRPEWREPLVSRFHGYRVIGAPPPSSGGVTLGTMMGVLAGMGDVGAYGGARWAHTYGSVSQRAFIERNHYLGDPAFVQVPLDRLTSPAHAGALRATIDLTRAARTADLEPRLTNGVVGAHTTHFVVADAQGNVVSATTTLNDLFGSGVYVAEAGFFLNDQMDDFAARPGFPNLYGLVQGEANAIAPGKRMLSSMTPTIVVDSSGRTVLALGARGGPRIISAVAQVTLNVLHHRMILSDAVAAPRLHHQALPDSLQFERHGVTEAVADSLRAMGHLSGPRSNVAQITALMRVRGGWEGVADPRGAGRAVGY